MTESVVNATYKAVLSLSLLGSEDQTQDINAVMVTGFTGFLTLPPALVADWRLPFTYVGLAFLTNDE